MSIGKKASSEARRERLGFSIELGVLVPEYIIDGFLFLDDKYEGGYLYRDKINLQLALGGGKPLSLHYGFDRKTPNRAPTKVSDAQVSALEDGQFEFRIPIVQKTRPGLTATLVLRTQPWM